MQPTLADALAQWASIVGAEHVLSAETDLSRYTANVSGLKRHIGGVVRPDSTADVIAVVQAANRCRVPLYPLSTGRNLGLGSRLPVRDGQVVLDLGRMNRILEVNADSLYAVVEPGVTQGQLADHLAAAGLPLMVNVTGAGRDTSLIGNSLERGIGYFASRADSLSALEVVLGDGRLLRTGFGHIPGVETAHVYKYGIGPDLGALFYQSNFGVVTSAGVPLLPQRDRHSAVLVSIAEDSQLPDLIDRLRLLRRRGVIQTVVHVGNRHRTHLAVGSNLAERLAEQGLSGPELRAQVDAHLRAEGFGAWSAVWGVMGTPAQVRDARREVRRTLAGRARIVWLDARKIRVATAIINALSFLPAARRKAMILPGVSEYIRLAAGTPTDEALKGLNWALGILAPVGSADPDREGWGMLYCLPFMPLRGDHAHELVAITERIYGQFDFTPYITLNIVDDRALEAVINLAFHAHSKADTERAHAASHALYAALKARGWMPYRVGVEEMAGILDPQSTFWQVAGDLKRALDPNGIISPGRYNCL